MQADQGRGGPVRILDEPDKMVDGIDQSFRIKCIAHLALLVKASM
jgi:hypothetical protein